MFLQTFKSFNEFCKIILRAYQNLPRGSNVDICNIQIYTILQTITRITEVDGTDSTPTTAALRLTSNAATAAEGSQCSSSCSTVVVVNAPAGGPPRMRRTSATSSLELGYSHTAQNSAVSSETASFPGAIYDRCKKGGKYAGKFYKKICIPSN